ncbi:hypothetical protein P5V15_002098 [Pogonomyrmex californicus]
MESIHHKSEQMADAQVMQWPLVPSSVPVISISIVYLYIIYFAGPRFMKDRKPYSLKTFIQCYNIFQVIANFWLVYNTVIFGKPFSAIWRFCDTFDEICGRDGTEKQLEILWWALLLKIADLIETIVFVLRKKSQQVSFLHTYHHVSTVIYVWSLLRYFVHSFSMVLLMFNCSVHVIMYSYYYLSTYGSHVQQKILPFKKWITTLQMAQIAIITIIPLQGLVFKCNSTTTLFPIITFFNGVINLSFFWNFFTSYKKLKAV